MKLINEMDSEELKDLVSYTSADGTVLYFSKIDFLSEDKLFYNGETFNINNIKTFESIKNRIAVYEAYKLLNNRENIQDLIEEQISKRVDTTLTRIIKSTTADLGHVANELHKDHSALVENIMNILRELDTAGKNIVSTQEDLERTTRNLDNNLVYQRRTNTEYTANITTILTSLNTALDNVNNLFKGITDVEHTKMEASSENEGAI